MAITIIPSEQEGYSPKLEVKGLVAGDYIIMSVDGFLKDQDGEVRSWTNTSTKYGKSTSYLAFVDVFEYEYFDVDKREVVKKKFSEPGRCSFFVSAAIKRKYDESKVPEGQTFKLGMKKLEGGKSTYVIESYDLVQQTPVSTSPETQNEEISKDVSDKSEEPKKTDTEGRVVKLEKAVNDLKKSEMFNDEQVVQMLKNNGYTEEEVKRYL